MKPSNPSPSHPRFLPIGERYFHLAEFPRCIDHYTLILEYQPHNLRAYLMRALCYESICDAVDMNVDLEVIFRSAPQSAEAAFGRGLQLRFEAATNAIAHFDEAIARDPAFSYAYEFRGQLRLDHGDLLGAIEDYTACLKICPPYALARLYRADAFKRIGDMAHWVRDLEIFLEFYPNTIMRERMCKQIAYGWYQLAEQAAQERERPKNLWNRFWKAYDRVSLPLSNVWRDPEDINC